MLDREPSPFETSDVEPAEASAPRPESSPRGTPAGQGPPGYAAPAPQPSEWRGADDATDFLGLDQEVNTVAIGLEWNAGAADIATDRGAQVSVAETHVLPDGSNSWLLSLDDARAGAAGHKPVASDTEAAAGADEAEAPTPLDTSWTDASPKKKSFSKLLVRGVAAAAILALSVSIYQTYRAPRHSQPWTKPIAPSKVVDRTHEELSDPTATDSSPRADARTGQPINPTPVAITSESDPRTSPAESDAVSAPDASVQSSATTEPATDTLAGTASTAETSGSDESAPSDSSADASSPSAPADPDAFPATWPVSIAGSTGQASTTSTDAETGPRDASDPGVDAGPFGPRAAFANMTPIRAADANPPVGPERDASGAAPPASFSVEELEAATRESRTLDVKPEHMAAAQRSKNALRVATKEDLAGVWEGNTIPLDAVDQPNRILTPNVGRVRILLKGREVFEGRLYAIGQGKVWIDTELGRMALFSEMLRKIEQLSSPDGTPVLGQKGSQELAGLPRVRVRSLGGVFFGKIIAQDESTLTMITDEGARITLETTDYEPAPRGSVVVVKRKL